jgi:hypothetical protein
MPNDLSARFVGVFDHEGTFRIVPVEDLIPPGNPAAGSGFDFTGHGDPNGVVTGTLHQTYLDLDSGAVFVHDDTVDTNDGWLGGYARAALIAGAPSDGAPVTDDVWAVTQFSDNPTTGTFTVTFRGYTTDPMPYDITEHDAAAVLEQLPSIGIGNVAPYVGLGFDGDSTLAIQGALLFSFTGELGGMLIEDPPEITDDTTDGALGVIGVIAGGGSEPFPNLPIGGLAFSDENQLFVLLADHTWRLIAASVSSVNGQTGDVTLVVGVSSVNGQTGDVTLVVGVSSVNGQTGDVVVVSSVNGQTGDVTLPEGEQSGIVATNAAGIPPQGMRIWLDAADRAARAVDGDGAVTVLADRSGNGIDFSGAGPTVLADDDGLNGLDVLEFASVPLATTGSRDRTDFLHERASTVFVVAKPTTGTLLGSRAALSATDCGIEFAIVSGLRWLITGPNGVVCAATAPTLSGDEQLFTVLSDPANATAAARCSIFIDGVDSGAVNGQTPDPVVQGSDYPLGLGGSPGSLSTPLVGDVAEVIIYERLLDADERARVEGYLRAKWFDIPAVGSIRTVIANDEDVTVDAFNGTTLVLYTALTAPRAVTLPPADGPTQQVIVADALGLATDVNTITLVPVGGDSLQSDIINTPTQRAFIEVVNDATNAYWYSLDASSVVTNQIATIGGALIALVAQLGGTDGDGNVYSIAFDAGSETLSLICTTPEGDISKALVSPQSAALLLNMNDGSGATMEVDPGILLFNANDVDSNVVQVVGYADPANPNAGITMTARNGASSILHKFGASQDGIKLDGVLVDPSGGSEGDVLAQQGDGSLKLQPGADGLVRLHRIPFSFDTPGLLTGAPLYTPTVGEQITGLAIEVLTAWDGATPKGEIGTFVGSTTGLFTAFGTFIAMDSADYEGLFGDGLRAPFVSNQIPTSIARGMRATVIAPNPICVCVSQDATSTGADPGSTQGEAILHLLSTMPTA